MGSWMQWDWNKNVDIILQLSETIYHPWYVYKMQFEYLLDT